MRERESQEVTGKTPRSGGVIMWGGGHTGSFASVRLHRVEECLPQRERWDGSEESLVHFTTNMSASARLEVR